MSEPEAKYEITPPGKEPDNEYQAYRQAPGISSSILAAFAEAPDVALMEREQKAYFEEGKAFERILQDAVTGSTLFDQRFFVTTVTGNMPDEMIAWIDAGEDLAGKYCYNKDGVTLNGTKKTLHAFLDACREQPGKYPITGEQYAMLSKMVRNTLDCKLSLFSGDPGVSMADVLAGAYFQVPIYWEDMGNPKKALLDALATLTVAGEETLVAIDFKSSASLSQFRSMYFSKYWVQDRHYSEGLFSLGRPCYPHIIFAVAAKAKPFLAQCFRARDDRRETNIPRYEQLCTDFAEWDALDRPGRGWKETAEL